LALLSTRIPLQVNSLSHEVRTIFGEPEFSVFQAIPRVAEGLRRWQFTFVCYRSPYRAALTTVLLGLKRLIGFGARNGDDGGFASGAGHSWPLGKKPARISELTDAINSQSTASR